MSKREKILITGASGFVGQALVKKLITDKSKKIVATTNSKCISELISSENLIWRKVDLLKDNLKDLLAGIDVVYHLVGYSGLGTSDEELTKLTLLNEELTSRLLEYSKQADIKHFIYVSSISACENSNEKNIDEENGFPQSLYGISKKKTEEIIFSFSGNPFPVTILRPTALFGKHHKGSIYELTKRVKENRFLIFGSGENFTNFYYIDEFTNVLKATCLNKDMFGEIYIASSDPLTLNRLARLISTVLKISPSFIWLPLSVGYLVAYFFDFLSFFISQELPLSKRRMEAMTGSKVYSNGKLKLEGLSKKSETERGLKETVQWFLDNKML